MFEEKIEQLVMRGAISGFVHLYIGEEAIAAGGCAALEKADYITSTHRGHGHLIAKGGDVKRMMAEIFGRKTGYCKGKGGSMHIADLDLGILGANGIVGGGPPIAVGSALASWYRDSDRVTACFFGDGASNQGTTHEAMNLASVLKLPVIFVAENNRYAEFTKQSRHQNIESVAERAAAYGIPGIVVDGNDIFAVHEAAGEAVLYAREGKGPTLVECMTYRVKGHFVGDPEAYRSPEEVAKWRTDEMDPIRRFEKRLLEMNYLSDAAAKDIFAAVRQEIDDAVRFAEDSPLPALEELYTDVYVS